MQVRKINSYKLLAVYSYGEYRIEFTQDHDLTEAWICSKKRPQHKMFMYGIKEKYETPEDVIKRIIGYKDMLDYYIEQYALDEHKDDEVN